MSTIELSSPQSLRRRVIWAGALNIGSILASQVIRLGGNLVVTRLLIPEMFGLMAIATAVSVLLLLLSDVGLRQNVIQSARGDDPAFLNTIWTVQIIRGFTLFVVMQLVALTSWVTQQMELWPAHSTYADPQLPLVLAVTGFFAILYAFQSTNIDVAIRLFQQKRVVLAELISQIAGLVVMLVAGYLTRSIWSMVASGLVSTLVLTVLSHTMFQGPRNRIQWDPEAFREIFNYGRWILLSSAVGVLAMQGDRIWFGGTMTVAELGVYSIAVGILLAIQTSLLRLAGAVALPAFSEAARSGDMDRLRKLYFRFRLLFDFVSLFACGFLLTASPLIIGWLYDARYAGAGEMMAILSLSFFTLRYSLTHQIWMALGLTKYMAMDNIIRVVALFTLLPLLLAIGGVTWGLWGVALHTYFTLFLIFKVSHQLGMLSIKRELVVLPFMVLGALAGAFVTRLFA
ncbi:oligosaccharide flippase family protein [Pseudomonas alkylphenolica]|uniref:oligosaccharide flippase family protein n=1 Tax=Pseudomonas alkylphenolica TaxID=237609 RepID=UPI0018D865D0|nr:oligosaccharide flippase family protein [Pseudomonas alkylphenolica]MBH3426217.1 oligosaccharide flippase family protein [Pseudomonas alkylphenolica]